MNPVALPFQNPSEASHMEFPPIKQKAIRASKRILFAEDNDDLRYVMDCVLKDLEYTVVSCSDAQHASETFSKQPDFDILLTDYEMPGRTGIELARELTHVSPGLPVVILTGSSLSAQIHQEIQDRNWTYISKPCDAFFLETTLKHILKPEHRLAVASGLLRVQSVP